LERATIEQIRNRLLDEGIATAAEIDDHLANIGGGQLERLFRIEGVDRGASVSG
jgi:hypothetical protein